MKIFSEATLPKINSVSPCDLAWFSSFSKHSPKINTVSPSCSTCNMLYDAYAMQNDVMMLCYAKWYLCWRYTHIPTVEYTIFLLFIFRLHRLFFGVSALTFRCKPPLGASSPFTSAVFALTFRALPYTSAESAFTFRCKLCITFGTTFEQKTYAALP